MRNVRFPFSRADDNNYGYLGGKQAPKPLTCSAKFGVRSLSLNAKGLVGSFFYLNTRNCFVSSFYKYFICRKLEHLKCTFINVAEKKEHQ